MPRKSFYLVFALLFIPLACSSPKAVPEAPSETPIISPEPSATFTPDVTPTPTYIHLVYLLAGVWKGIYEDANGERLDVVLEIEAGRFPGTNQFSGTMLFYRDGGEGKAWFPVYPTLEKNTIYFQIEPYMPQWNDGLPLHFEGAYYYFTHDGGNTLAGSVAIQCYQCFPFATVQLTRVGSEYGLIEQIIATPIP